MKKKNKLIITGVLLVALIMACLPTSVYAAIYQAGAQLFADFTTMSDEEIYNSKKNIPASDLVDEIIELESALPSMNDKIAIVPHLMALIEKADSFTADELVSLIKDPETDVALDSAFIKMYANIGADFSDLLPLLNDSQLAQESKEYIIALGDFSVKELSGLFNTYNDSLSIVAMKQIAVIDEQTAFKLAAPLVSGTQKVVSNEKYIAAFLGVAAYYDSADGELTSVSEKETKQQLISAMKNIYDRNDNDLVKDQAIYAMARMDDYETFAYIIASENIDFDLKVTTIERNVNLMIDVISTATKAEEISPIIAAMKLHPISQVGVALEQSVESGKMARNQDITDTIAYIEKFGIEGVDKYD